MKSENDTVSFFILYNSYYAYVDSAFVSDFIRFRQSLGSYKTFAVLKFLLENKRVHIVSPTEFKLQCSELEREFLRIAHRIRVGEWGLWRKVVDKLEEGQSKREVLNWLAAEAITRGLTL